MNKLSFTLVLSLLFNLGATAQSYHLDPRSTVTVQGNFLRMPWTGGLNSPIVNEIDMDGDSDLDILLFDRIGNRITCLENTSTPGQPSYYYRPLWSQYFPDLHDWVRTVDYDCDGDLDLFTYTSNAMGVYRNDFTAGALVFTPVTQSLNSNYGSLVAPIFVSQVNMPALVDMDSDGDLDVLTFANSSTYVEYHRNYSVDSTGSCSGFLFHLEPYCWGYFKLSSLTNIALLNQNCRSGFNGSEPESRHSGSVMTAFDNDCDGDFEIINGDILGENLLFLENGGTPDSAYITSQDSAFPSYSVPLDMHNLPAAYLVDVDADGLKDMVVAPYATVGEDYENMHLYKNFGTACSSYFSPITNRLWIEDMVDVGTAANPAFFDVDADGLTDLLIGNDVLYNSDPALSVSRISYFRNTGSATLAEFTLITNDWLNLSSLNGYSFYPAFGDLDGDFDSDLLIGLSDGTMIYYQNTAATGQAPNFVLMSPQYQAIDIGNHASPQIIDVNRDGKNDLLIGERNGNLNYYENTATASAPVFTLQSSAFGGVNVLQSGAIAGYSCPLLFDDGGTYRLWVGSVGGTLFEYTGIDGNLTGTFTLSDSSAEGINESSRSVPAMSDLDNDGIPELAVGNNAGGLRLYTQTALVGLSETGPEALNWSLYPNPASESCTIYFKGNSPGGLVTLSVIDIQGRVVEVRPLAAGESTLPLSHLAPGSYVVRLEVAGAHSSKKLLLVK